MTLTCPGCQKDFIRSHGRQKYCTRKCGQAHYQKAFYKANPGYNERYAGAAHLKHRYGITMDQYEVMLLTQGGTCAICGESPEKLVVDHCHDTGAVRGLLCDFCNKALGFLKDSIENLDHAKEYLGKA